MCSADTIVLFCQVLALRLLLGARSPLLVFDLDFDLPFDFDFDFGDSSTIVGNAQFDFEFGLDAGASSVGIDAASSSS